MKLEVIGAGFGRTGTHSLYFALNKLGYHTFHTVKAIDPPDGHSRPDPLVWVNARDHPEEPIDWKKAYGDDYNAALDFPTCSFYKELMEANPSAKVILTVRSPESWYQSACKTIFRMFIEDDKSALDGNFGDILRMVIHTAFDGLLEVSPEKVFDGELMCRLYIEHIEEVKRTVPADRLLVFHLGDGWEPLCNFLDKPVPNEPFPRSNDKNHFKTRVEDAKIRDRI
ncbi:P-loop containing nucleoside triphosphate hydrolase protein [Gongronella butleri]|nr:P-loop containing nucleoside triphosphate hydrolase protein [Gongronella butleri]